MAYLSQWRKSTAKVLALAEESSDSEEATIYVLMNMMMVLRLQQYLKLKKKLIAAHHIWMTISIHLIQIQAMEQFFL